MGNVSIYEMQLIKFAYFFFVSIIASLLNNQNKNKPPKHKQIIKKKNASKIRLQSQKRSQES